jgi:hypothetical protein
MVTWKKERKNVEESYSMGTYGSKFWSVKSNKMVQYSAKLLEVYLPLLLVLRRFCVSVFNFCDNVRLIQLHTVKTGIKVVLFISLMIKAINRTAPKRKRNWTMLNSRITSAILSGEMIRASAARGWPQGGVLSPLLWSLVVDDLLWGLNSNGYSQ